MKLAVLGAKGGVGEKLIQLAHAAKHDVVAIDLDWSNQEKADGVTLIEADVLNDDLSGAFSGCDAVLSCLGVGNSPKVLLNPPPLYTEGTKNIISAMTVAKVDRLIVISASFVEEKNRGPLYFKLPVMAALFSVLNQMADMEALLEASSLNFTAVRPGWLMQGPLTEDYVVTNNVIPNNLIRSRMSDVAHFMLQIAQTGEWSRQTPALAREESPDASSLSAVAREIMG